MHHTANALHGVNYSNARQATDNFTLAPCLHHIIIVALPNCAGNARAPPLLVDWSGAVRAGSRLGWELYLPDQSAGISAIPLSLEGSGWLWGQRCLGAVHQQLRRAMRPPRPVHLPCTLQPDNLGEPTVYVYYMLPEPSE